MTRQRGWQNEQAPLTVPGDSVQAGQSIWARRIILLWLLGTLVLLPVDLIKLPLNMTLVDCWILMGLPIFWLAFVRGPYVISWLYAVPMWLILVASFASSFAAPAPSNSLVVIMKEVYAYIWFVTLTALIARLNVGDLRLMLTVWTGMVLLHGFVIVGQFLSPEIWRFTVSFAGSLKDFEIYRPAGLFVNANSAAFFQLLGFVPLVLVSPSQKVAMILGVVLLITMLLTGSMGAAVAFAVGLIIAVVASILSGHLSAIVTIFARLALTVVLLGGILLFIISQNQRYQEHFSHIFLGRAERSSEGRFDLWQRGIEVFIEHDVLLWGIGPENFREVDWQGKQLHNDILAFSVERGLLGTLGLVLFVAVVASRGAYLVLLQHRHLERGRIVVVVFLGATIAAIVESLTHQTFHFRELWFVWALQEAMFFHIAAAAGSAEPTMPRLNEEPYGRRLVIQPNATR